MLAARTTSEVGTQQRGSQPGPKDHIAAAGVIGSHVLQHTYGHAFFVILTAMYATLGLSPVTAALIGSVRQLSSGMASTVGGVVVDRLQHRRLMILYISMATLGVGYLLVGFAPTYFLIIVALGFTAAAGSIWHPAARSLLSQIYPRRRGFMISMDRSAGSVGDTIGPLLAGLLLLYIAWQQIFMLAFPMAMAVVVFLWLVLRRSDTFQDLGARKPAETRPVLDQFRAMVELLRGAGKALSVLLVVKGVAGLGQGGLMLFVPLYLSQTQDMGYGAIGFHVALLTGAGIATGPLFGYLSDRHGRVPVIILVLAGKAVVAGLLAVMGTGIMLTILIAALGGFMFGVNSLIQAWALDLADGRKLEGTMMGGMYGINMLFQGVAPLILGFVIAALGYGILFWYVAGMNALGVLLVALAIPLVFRGTTGNRTGTGTGAA